MVKASLPARLADEGTETSKSTVWRVRKDNGYKLKVRGARPWYGAKGKTLGWLIDSHLRTWCVIDRHGGFHFIYDLNEYKGSAMPGHEEG